MQNSFRWYGPSDPVTLSDIRQSNAEYIVTSLHQIPYGEKWSKTDVKKRIDFINKHNNSNNVNLKWNVVESIPVHNDIKLRHKNFRKFIDNYKDTILNVSKNNIQIAKLCDDKVDIYNINNYNEVLSKLTIEEVGNYSIDLKCYLDNYKIIKI